MRRVAPPILVLIGLTACGGEGPGGATSVRDSAGLRIAVGPEVDVMLSWSVQTVWELAPGGLDLFTLAPHHVAPFGGGRLALLDDAGLRLHILGPDGTVERSWARGGEGPGELSNPNALTARGDTVFVMDVGRGGLLLWRDGEEIGREPVGAGFWGPSIRRYGSGVIYVRLPGRGTAVQELAVVVEGEAHPITRLTREPERPADLRKCGVAGFPVPPLFAPELSWDTDGETVAAVTGPAYEIELHRGAAGLRALLRRPLPALEPGRALAASEIAGETISFSMLGGRVCEITVDELIEWRGMAEPVPPLFSVAVMPWGEVWAARRSERLRSWPVDVWSLEGAYVGTLEIEDGIPVGGLETGEIVIVGRDELELPLLRVLSIDRGTDPVPAIRTRVAVAPGSRPDAGGAAPGAAGVSPPRDPRVRPFRDCGRCPAMMALPGGTFRMGAPEGEAPAASDPTRPEWTELAEKPPRDVRVAPFAIGTYEVTFDEWAACAADGACPPRSEDEGWGQGRRPVIHVTRADAAAYADWLSGVTGETYRLPSEAEWEYAARAGTETAYWWGDAIGPEWAACDGCGTEWDRRSTAPVGTFPANPFGLHDMLGNVSEWVADCWHEDHAGATLDGRARMETSPWWKDGACERATIRGGAFSFHPWALRAAHRSYYWPGPWEEGSYTRGFRVARELGGVAEGAEDGTVGEVGGASGTGGADGDAGRRH